MPSPLSRRDLLTRSAALAALGATGSLAGCTELDVLGGSDDDLVEELRTWLPAPETFSSDAPPGRYFFFGSDLTRVRAAPERAETMLNVPEQSRVDHLGVDAEDVDRAFQISFVSTVLAGDFDSGSVADALTSTGLDPDGAVGDFRLFEGKLEPPGTGSDGPPRRHRIAVGSSHVVEMRLDTTELPPSTVDRIVETHEGERERYADANADIAALLDAQGDAMGVSGRARPEPVDEQQSAPESGSFVGLVASGSAVEVSGDVLRLNQVSVLDSPDDIDREAIANFVEQLTTTDDGIFDYDHVETTVDDRVVQVVFETPLDELHTPTSPRS